MGWYEKMKEMFFPVPKVLKPEVPEINTSEMPVPVKPEDKKLYLTYDTLKRIEPEVPEHFIIPINDTLERFQINKTPKRAAMFLAQIFHETGNLKRLVENLNYSANRITEVWPSRFKSVLEAQPYAYNPQKLANQVYANRYGNGNPQSGDGWEFRGRGAIQTTFRDNYRDVGMGLHGDPEYYTKNPDLVAEPLHAILTAGWYWEQRGLNEIMDKPEDWTVKAGKRIMNKYQYTSYKINGSISSHPERLKLYKKILPELPLA